MNDISSPSFAFINFFCLVDSVGEPAFTFSVNSSSSTALAVGVVTVGDQVVGPSSLTVSTIEDGFQVFGITFGDLIPPIEEEALLVTLTIITPVEETGLLLVLSVSLANSTWKSNFSLAFFPMRYILTITLISISRPGDGNLVCLTSAMFLGPDATPLEVEVPPCGEATVNLDLVEEDDYVLSFSSTTSVSSIAFTLLVSTTRCPWRAWARSRCATPERPLL